MTRASVNSDDGILVIAGRYESHSVFAKIDRPHRRIHEIAGQIDNCWCDGKIEGARSLIPDLLAARDETLALLLQLQRQVGVRRI